jgi:hypothetical protein
MENRSNTIGLISRVVKDMFPKLEVDKQDVENCLQWIIDQLESQDVTSEKEREELKKRYLYMYNINVIQRGCEVDQKFTDFYQTLSSGH